MRCFMEVAIINLNNWLTEREWLFLSCDNISDCQVVVEYL